MTIAPFGSIRSTYSETFDRETDAASRVADLARLVARGELPM